MLDKLNFFKIKGHWFALYGFLNIICFGTSFLSHSPEWYRYHFAFTTYPARMFKPVKCMMGSENFLNVIWTAPLLIGLNFYMHKRLGALTMTKFFALSFAATWAFYTAVNPESGLNFRPLQKYLPKFDSYADDGSYYMGAD